MRHKKRIVSTPSLKEAVALGQNECVTAGGTVPGYKTEQVWRDTVVGEVFAARLEGPEFSL